MGSSGDGQYLIKKKKIGSLSLAYFSVKQHFSGVRDVQIDPEEIPPTDLIPLLYFVVLSPRLFDNYPFHTDRFFFF
jgi:hypothetical protein